MANFSESDTEALIEILRNQFVDIPKIISLVDPNRATEFKKRNQLAHMAKHTHDSKEGSCCSVQNKIYIEPKDLSSVEKAINEVLTSASFFKSNLREILDKVDAAQKSMKKRATERCMMLDEAMEKELLSKCLMETVNRQIFSHVYTQLKKQDQTYSKQPGLLAHPQTVVGQSDCNLDQLSTDEFSQFVSQGFVFVKNFLKHGTYDRVVKPLLKRLTLLEMEGKFDVRRPQNAVTPVTRHDKFFDFSLNQLEKEDELKDLR